MGGLAVIRKVTVRGLETSMPTTYDVYCPMFEQIVDVHHTCEYCKHFKGYSKNSFGMYPDIEIFCNY